MSKSERDSAARRKRAADPNQPRKSGAAKPTNVSTDPKRKMKEEFVTEKLSKIAKLLKLINVGKRVKVITKEIIRPKVIINPKSIIGFISLNTKDKKANIVVKAV